MDPVHIGLGFWCEATPHVRRHHEQDDPQRTGGRTRQADRRLERPVHPDGVIRASDGDAVKCMAVHRRAGAALSDDRAGMEVRGSARTHRATHDRRGPLGALGSGRGRPAREWRRPPLSDLLDAAVWTGRPAAFAQRYGLGWAERGEHGDDPPRRRLVRRV